MTVVATTSRVRPAIRILAPLVIEPVAGDPIPDALLVQLGTFALGDAGRVAVRERAIERYLPLAATLARRYAGRGEPFDDLMQVAVISLISAVDRFEAGRGVPFPSYATPTILGGIKRHFRDTTWNVRVPRRLQELRMHLATATEELTHTLPRSPTTGELATHLDVGLADVWAARLSANAYRPVSFDHSPNGQALTLVDTIGDVDPGIEAADWRAALRLGLAGLPDRDRRIIALRFFADMTQTQIAIEVGVSQMHVSRLLTSALAQLREGLLAEDEPDTGAIAHDRRLAP